MDIFVAWYLIILLQMDNGGGVTAVPMPNQTHCVAAVEEVKKNFRSPHSRAFCIQGLRPYQLRNPG